MMVPANAFWMIPHAAAAGTPTAAPTFAACSNQQIRALSPSLTPVFNVAAAWPISPFVASTKIRTTKKKKVTDDEPNTDSNPRRRVTGLHFFKQRRFCC